MKRPARLLLQLYATAILYMGCESHETQCLAKTESNQPENFLYKDACLKVALAQHISSEARDTFLLTCLIQEKRKQDCKEGLDYPEFDYDND